MSFFRPQIPANDITALINVYTRTAYDFQFILLLLYVCLYVISCMSNLIILVSICVLYSVHTHCSKVSVCMRVTT